MLQEVAFDMGCSSYALGKIYDYFCKIITRQSSNIYIFSSIIIIITILAICIIIKHL